MLMGDASRLADDYDQALAEVIALAKSCTEEDWRTPCPGDGRTVGVVFDHISRGNPQVVAWFEEFLADRPVQITPEILNQRNAHHAAEAEQKPRHATVEDLEESTPRTSQAIRALTDEQMKRTQEFGWAGRQDVAWVASAAVRHPRGHLKTIREALGR